MVIKYTMCNWMCYLIKSICSNETYIGSTNNLKRRLKQHNGILKNGAKKTAGRKWEIVIVVSNFDNKNQCLSFEAIWKNLRKTRSNKKLIFLNDNVNTKYKYSNDVLHNRIIDLLYFTYNFNIIDNKFIITHNKINAFICTKNIKICFLYSIVSLSFPYFIHITQYI